MVAKDQVMKALDEVMDPEIHKSLVELNMVRDIQIDGGSVRVTVVLTIQGCPLKHQIQKDVEAKVGALPGVDRVEVIMGAMTDEERQKLTQDLRGGRERTSPLLAPGARTRIIGIGSGKGGVGKSTCTVNLGVALARLGYQVGVLDADIYGYSVSRMLGLRGRPTVLDEKTIMPQESHGVKAISMGSLVDEDTPILWRGPMLGRILDQFINDVHWGDLDYLLMDLPPGTGDIALSIAQTIPKAELILVTTPQAASARVAARAANMARKTNQRVVGVIENMAYFICDGCDKPHEIFGQGGGQALASEMGTVLLGRVPLTPQVREGGDAGVPVVVADPESPAAQAFNEIAKKVTELSPAGLPVNG